MKKLLKKEYKSHNLKKLFLSKINKTVDNTFNDCEVTLTF
jgi:hypothetical protein